MSITRRTTAISVATAATLMLAGGVAYAYWTTTGQGDGAALSRSNVTTTITAATATADLYPGGTGTVKFTLDNFNDPIRANAMNRRVAQDNCIRCHAGVVSEIHRTASGEIQLCLSCHVRVGHI